MRIVAVISVLGLAACATERLAVPVAEPWPAADALFRSDARWLGGDAIYSVDLGHDRVLWLFGDSFVATNGERDRRASVMVRNTLAVQQGRDPARATIAFHWHRGEDGRPMAFFGDAGEIGYWPLHGIRLAEGPLLLLFQVCVRATPGQGLGFAIDGCRVLRVEDPDREPGHWRSREMVLPALPVGITLGTAVWREGEHLVVLGTHGHGPHRGVLARLPIGALLDDAAQLEWWTGQEWQPGPAASPATVLEDAGPECSLDRVASGWRHVYSRGFGATAVAMRGAAAVTGPWSVPQDVFTPPESQRPRPFVYAAKAHPALAAGPGRFAVSYASNSFAFADLFTPQGQEELYWPRFWRLAEITP